jgi:hypothetical protein
MAGGKSADQIVLGEKLNNGVTVIGIIDKLITEAIVLPDTQRTIVTPSTLVWSNYSRKYLRASDIVGCKTISYKKPVIFRAFIVSPNSTIITDSGLHLRDYIEVLSPDTEDPYAETLRCTHETRVIKAK